MQGFQDYSLIKLTDFKDEETLVPSRKKIVTYVEGNKKHLIGIRLL